MFVIPGDVDIDHDTARDVLCAVSAALDCPPLRYVLTAAGARLATDPTELLLAGLRAAPLLTGRGGDTPILAADRDASISVAVLRPVDGRWLTVTAPADHLARMAGLVRTLGPMARATWAVAGDDPDHRPPITPAEILAGVPDVRPALGWACYWSPVACAEAGFSLADPRAALFARAVPAPPGVFLQLTGEPLDLTRSEHRAAITAVFAAFPRL